MHYKPATVVVFWKEICSFLEDFKENLLNYVYIYIFLYPIFNFGTNLKYEIVLKSKHAVILAHIIIINVWKDCIMYIYIYFSCEVHFLESGYYNMV